MFDIDNNTYNNVTASLRLISNPRNYYDAAILAFKYLPPKSVALTAAVLTSSVALYMLKPETLLCNVGIVGASSAISWVTAESAHYFASKAFDKRISELPRQEVTQQGKNEISNMLDNLGI